jgi:tetratricopeptide (TPR) repeat protein
MKKRFATIWIFSAFLLGWGILGYAQDPVKTLLDSGITFFKDGKYKEAVDILKDVLRKSVDMKDRSRAYVYMAYSYFYEREIDPKNLDLAKDNLGKAIEINPDIAVGPPEFIPEFSALFKQIKETLVGLVTIDTLPPQANVFLDDIAAGKTPQVKELLANKYVLRLVKWGYAPFEMLMEIKKTETLNIKINLNDEKNWKTFIRSGLAFLVVAILVKSI